MPDLPGLPAGLTSRAILIGTTTYRDPEFTELPAVARSLDRMRAILTDERLCGWSDDEVTVIQDPENIQELAPRLRRLIENTDGALLLYYAGHGLVRPNAQLCLTLTDTNPAEPDVSSLTFEKVRDNLLGCPARVRILILDCCHAGRATRSLSGPGSAGIGALGDTHLDIEGTYTLAAAEGTADVVPLPEQNTTPTSFTRHLAELVEEGVLGGPELLSLGFLFPHLKSRLARHNLPLPTQGNTKSSYLLPFTRNAAWEAAARALDEYRSTMAEILARNERRQLDLDLLADALSLSSDAAHAYLSGHWVASEEILRDYFAVLDAHDCAPHQQTKDRLAELRAIAEDSTANDPREVPALLERNRAQAREIRQLRGALARERSHTAEVVTAREEADRAQEAAALARAAADEEAEQRSRLAAEELKRLRKKVDAQRRQLVHASRYTRDAETELTALRREAERVERELRVLRRQVAAMMNDPGVPPQSVSADTADTTDSATTGRVPAPVPEPVPVGAGAATEEEAAPGPTPPSRPRSAGPPPPHATTTARRSWRHRLARSRSRRSRTTCAPGRRSGRSSEWSRPAQVVIVLIGLVVVGSGVFWGYLLRAEAVGDLSAKPCASAATGTGTGDCIAPETGRVTHKEHTTSNDSDTWTLTVARETAGNGDYDVGHALYDSVETGSTVDLKVWKGEVIRVEHAGHSDRVRESINWRQFLAFLLVATGIVLTVAVLKRAEFGETAFVVVWFSVWEVGPGMLFMNGTSWWTLLGLLWAAFGIAGLVMIGE
ncbi:caspase domain-containing protein [Kitasatospora sp. NPDC089509]|uniref:caspase family protein n=1 Tax=Kitasatospora sp. NPDC089509 TaxID=3364079 RepID=UPI003817AAC3